MRPSLRLIDGATWLSALPSLPMLEAVPIIGSSWSAVIRRAWRGRRPHWYQGGSVSWTQLPQFFGSVVERTQLKLTLRSAGGLPICFLFRCHTQWRDGVERREPLGDRFRVVPLLFLGHAP